MVLLMAMGDGDGDGDDAHDYYDGDNGDGDGDGDGDDDDDDDDECWMKLGECLTLPIALFQGNLGWWNIIIWPDLWQSTFSVGSVWRGFFS